MKTFTFKKTIVPAVVLVISLIITFSLWSAIRNNLNEQLTTQFENQTKQITSLIQRRMDLYTNVTYGAQGLFAASQSVTSSEWIAYASELNLPVNYSGISSMNYIEQVPRDATSTYPYVIFPLTNKPDYYPITYTSTTSNTVLPMVGSAASSTPTTALGFDASSDPIRWQAMMLAASSDLPTASGVVLTITTHLPSFGIYVPIYANGMPHDTLAQRQKALSGFGYVSFRVANLFQGLTSDPIFDPNIDVEVYDASTTAGAGTSTLLFDKGDSTLSAVNPMPGVLSDTSHVTVGGRLWTLYFSPLPGYGLQSIESTAPYVIMIGGIIFSILLSWLIFIYGDSRDRAVALAKKITQDLEASQSLVKASMENAGDMIFIMKLGGKFIDVNPMAWTVLGYTKEELLKMSIGDVNIDMSPQKIKEMNDVMRREKAVTAEVMLRKKDGTVFPAEVRRTMFGDEKDPMAISIIRDISERRKSEEKLKERTDELQRLNALMVGRELKMAELKKQITDKLAK